MGVRAAGRGKTSLCALEPPAESRAPPRPICRSEDASAPPPSSRRRMGLFVRGGFDVGRYGEHEIRIIRLPGLHVHVEHDAIALAPDDPAWCPDVGEHLGTIRVVRVV